MNKLWCINLPEDPFSQKLLPVPSMKIAKSTVKRLQQEALEEFPFYAGVIIAKSIYYKVWRGTPEDHAQFLSLEENKNWWDESTFLSTHIEGNPDE